MGKDYIEGHRKNPKDKGTFFLRIASRNLIRGHNSTSCMVFKLKTKTPAKYPERVRDEP